MLFNHEGDCLAVKLRPGNVHGAEGWEELLLPEIERQQKLDQEKRIEVIIRAMPEIIKRVDAHLVVTGKGKLLNDLEALVHELGIKDRVTFTGFLPDDELPELYRLADVFVMPGVAELQSISTMEAMASGLPVIAANALALPELVHDGENGFLFAKDDTRSLGEAAVKSLSDEPLRNRMAKKSLEIIQIHDIGKTAETFEYLYHQMLGVDSRAVLTSV